MSGTSQGRLGILVGGGPAPGINGVISAVTIEAENRGCEVVGIYDGYKHLMDRSLDRLVEGVHYRRLRIPDVARIHFEGGSILRTSRANPTKSEATLQRVVDSLQQLGVRYLVTIGGDDTALGATHIARQAGGQIGVAHVPKTIDNDLPLPGDMPTFGFRTACDLGFQLLHNLMVDARTTNRWYFVVAMGRAAGHLALGMGKAAGATLVIIPEEFGDPQQKRPITLSEVVDILECAILKRRVLAPPRRDGVAVIAEGLLERMPEDELKKVPGARIETDEFGHLRLSELDLAYILKSEVQQRFQQRGEQLTIVHKYIGYELRCTPPNAFDCEYVRDLGKAAVHFALDVALQSEKNGALICIDQGQVRYLELGQLLGPDGRVRTRYVNTKTNAYRTAYDYMIRLRQSDFDDPDRLAALAAEAKLSVEQFRQRYYSVVEHEATLLG